MPLLTNTQSTQAGSVIRLYRDRFRIASVAILLSTVSLQWYCPHNSVPS